MVDVKTLKEGQLVHYMPDYYKKDGRYENGVVKSIAPNGGVFVVYNCGGEWHRYKEYTAANTSATDLYMGWKGDQMKWLKGQIMKVPEMTISDHFHKIKDLMNDFGFQEEVMNKRRPTLPINEALTWYDVLDRENRPEMDTPLLVAMDDGFGEWEIDIDRWADGDETMIFEIHGARPYYWAPYPSLMAVKPPSFGQDDE